MDGWLSGDLDKEGVVTLTLFSFACLTSYFQPDEIGHWHISQQPGPYYNIKEKRLVYKLAGRRKVVLKEPNIRIATDDVVSFAAVFWGDVTQWEHCVTSQKAAAEDTMDDTA